MDKLCQWADYPFFPDKWMPLVSRGGTKELTKYVETYCLAEAYHGIGWSEINEEWRKIVSEGNAITKLPLLNEQKLSELREFWGSDYKDDEIIRMEKEYQDLKRTFNLTTIPQKTSALNLCKLSLRISSKISNNGEIDKDIKSYNELLKIGGFTVENSNKMGDFESLGEVYAYLEKTGWVNRYYDGAIKDDVDKTIANSQAFNRRLVLGETSMREQAEQKLANLGLGNTLEDGISEAELRHYEEEGLDEVLASSFDEEDAAEELNV
jgi:hypothetical protein